jgi:hypothetical protein
MRPLKMAAKLRAEIVDHLAWISRLVGAARQSSRHNGAKLNGLNEKASKNVVPAYIFTGQDRANMTEILMGFDRSTAGLGTGVAFPARPAPRA